MKSVVSPHATHIYIEPPRQGNSLILLIATLRRPALTVHSKAPAKYKSQHSIFNLTCPPTSLPACLPTYLTAYPPARLPAPLPPTQLSPHTSATRRNMGAAISRCTTRNARNSGPNLSEIGQRILDSQPNWLITPSRWRSRSSSRHPVRYRTPTPYPKDDRRPLPQLQEVHLSEKATVIETHSSSARHIEVVEPPKRQQPMQSNIPHIQLPPAAVTITWERHPRRNRFERIV